MSKPTQDQRRSPRKLDATARRRAVHLVTEGSAQTTKAANQELENTLGTSTSTRTVQRMLVEEGLEAVTKKPKPKLTKDHVKACLEFAEGHQHWTVEDWMRVGWSDETKINCYGSDGRVWVWKRSGEKLTNQLLKETVAHGGGSITIWGCMFWEGPGYATKLNNRLTKELYVEDFEDKLMASLEYYGKEVDDFMFMHDNASSHKAGLVRNWLADKGIKVLEWPAHSPDLNPIEHLWAHLKRELGKYPHPPKGVLELWERVETEWNKIDGKVCQDLIESMPRRIQAVLKAKGGHTDYQI
ncbi:hypothetical protein OPQ81_008631 [Rhizoctonia solani]|nr:hypothetical protein OPQ81_008631 [Rhizoctonia solani]